MSISEKVFVQAAGKLSRTFDIMNIMGLTARAGDIGIEIEMEGNKFPRGSSHGEAHYLPPLWGYHADGSLRGEDNAEYVLRKPLPFDNVEEQVNALFTCLDEFGSVLDESNRTSVHVHLNVQKWHLNRLCSFMALYFSVEELLTAWCGDHRVGNLFCLRAKDAPGIITKIKRFIRTNGTSSLSDGLHYSAMNAHAIAKFGSVEIRTLRGARDPETILKWVAILRQLYELSEQFEDPRTVCANFSGNGPMEYLQMVLGSHTNTILEGCGMDSQEVMSSLYEGIRLAQDVAYCRDWDEFKAMKVTPDPFGRSAKKVTKQLAMADTSWIIGYDSPPPVATTSPSSNNSFSPSIGSFSPYNLALAAFPLSAEDDEEAAINSFFEEHNPAMYNGNEGDDFDNF